MFISVLTNELFFRLLWSIYWAFWGLGAFLTSWWNSGYLDWFFKNIFLIIMLWTWDKDSWWWNEWIRWVLIYVCMILWQLIFCFQCCSNARPWSFVGLLVYYYCFVFIMGSPVSSFSSAFMVCSLNLWTSWCLQQFRMVSTTVKVFPIVGV